jgi:hypothetical protein
MMAPASLSLSTKASLEAKFPWASEPAVVCILSAVSILSLLQRVL